MSTNSANSELKLCIVISLKLYRTKIAFILLWIDWRVSAVVCLNNGAGGLGFNSRADETGHCVANGSPLL